MSHYFDGLDRNHHLIKHATAARIGEHMDSAEDRLIGHGIPTERRVGALAFWRVPLVLPEDDQPHSIVVTIRRFEDSPESMVAGDNWRVVSIVAKSGELDPAEEDMIIYLPYGDLKALRVAGGSCEGFEPYEESICYDAHGERYRRNDCNKFVKGILTIDELMDAWDPEHPEQIREFAEAQHARDGDLRLYPRPVLVHG